MPTTHPRSAVTASLDRAIIAELERDGRLSNVDLAARVGLTTGPCLRRVQRLEAAGVIRGYRAIIDAAAIGRGFEVLLVADLPAYETFLSSRVMTIAGVGRVHSRFAMKNIKGAAADL